MARYAHPERTVENIITTATALFLEKGYEQTSIQDILDALHLSKGGLYHHFESKEAILSAVMEHCSKEYQKQLHDIINSIEAENGKAKLKELLRYLASTCKSRYDQINDRIQMDCINWIIQIQQQFHYPQLSDYIHTLEDADRLIEMMIQKNISINPISISPQQIKQMIYQACYIKRQE
jgi:AcrR family transcriptional regulator